MIVYHKKNSAFELAVPMVSVANPETFTTGLSVTDTAYFKDGAGSWTSLAITDTFTEIGATGMYEISLTASEMNHDWVIIKLTAGSQADSFVTFKLNANEIDDLALAGVCTEVRLAELDSGNLPSDIDDILTNLPDIASLANIRTQVDDALVAINLDHLLFVAANGTHVTDNSIIAQMVAKAGTADWDTFDNTTDSLEALRDNQASPLLLQTTTILSLSSQTSFTLNAGSSDDTAYEDCLCIVTDQSTSTQKAVGIISAYTGSSKTVTLESDPVAGFVMANGDIVDIIAEKTITMLRNTFGLTTSDLLAELSVGLPPVNPTPAQAWMLHYMELRNLTEISTTELTIANDAGTTVTKATVSDAASKFTKQKLVSG